MGIEMSTVETGIDAGLVRAKRLENELETTENQEEVLAEIANELPTDEQVAPQFANLTELLKTRGINFIAFMLSVVKPISFCHCLPNRGPYQSMPTAIFAMAAVITAA
jgi:hypothetical protein